MAKRYRVLRDVGDSDYPPGSIVDPKAASPPWQKARVERLVGQRYLELVDDKLPEEAPAEAAPRSQPTPPEGQRRRGERG